MIYNIVSMLGLGDNIYQRSFIKKLEDNEVWLATPWPQLYSDMPNVHFYRKGFGLRTQEKNAIASRELYERFCPSDTYITKIIKYLDDGILTGMSRRFGFSPGQMTLPDFGNDFSTSFGKYVLIRPTTVRKEWSCPSRNCDPIYINECLKILKEKGIRTICIADLKEGEEWFEGDAPDADIQFYHGQIDVTEALQLVVGSLFCVGPIGWLYPACIAASKPLWALYGGYGAYNNPRKLTSRLNDCSMIKDIIPDNFCHCKTRSHNCDKFISNHSARFRTFVDSLS